MSTVHHRNDNDSPKPGGYRLKFDREEFLKILSIAEPKRLYKVSQVVYFTFDGFVMYCDRLSTDDLMRYDLINAIEFSNTPWKKLGN